MVVWGDSNKRHKCCEAQCMWLPFGGASLCPTSPHWTWSPLSSDLRLMIISLLVLLQLWWVCCFPWIYQNCCNRLLHWPFSLPGIFLSLGLHMCWAFYSGLRTHIPTLERPFLSILHKTVSCAVCGHKACIRVLHGTQSSLKLFIY